MTINRLNQGTTNQVLVKAISGQTTNLLELQDSSGNVVSSIGPTGALGGTVSQPQGLVHIKTADFSGAVSHSFGSDADPIFTSDYRNYKIIFENLQVPTSGENFSFRLRANTTDLNSSVYERQRLEVSGTSITADRTTTTFALIGAVGSTGATKGAVVLEIQNPQTAVNKSFQSLNLFMASGSSSQYILMGQIASTAQHNGFTIFTGQNISGTLSVYGYKI